MIIIKLWEWAIVINIVIFIGWLNKCIGKIVFVFLVIVGLSCLRFKLKVWGLILIKIGVVFIVLMILVVEKKVKGVVIILFLNLILRVCKVRNRVLVLEL